MIAVAATLIWRISAEPDAAPLMIAAGNVSLPVAETVTAVGSTDTALSFMTKDAVGVERLRVFDPVTGEEVGIVMIKRTE